VSRAGPRLAVLIPAYNAGRKLGDVLAGLAAHAAPGDTLVVDDGSTDDTAAVAERHGARVLRQTPNQGKASALRRGFAALEDYDLVATLDADGQHDPADLPRLLAAAAAGGADLVVGARTLAGRMPWHRRIGNRWASWCASRIAGQSIPDSQSGYRLHAVRLLREVVPRIPPESDGYLFETEMLVRAARRGFRLGAVPIATVYEDETSHFRPWREVPRFLRLFARLGWEALSGRLGPSASPSPPAARVRDRTC
jgi:glycosyltransferase involved in cell wall biosynthesis